jgi:TPR repeat protein
VAEVTYTSLDIRPLSGRMVMTGLSAAPYDMPGCLITMDRLVMTTAPLDQIAYGALDIDVMGVEVGPGCLSARELDDLAETGITELVLDSGRVRLEYDYATAGLRVDLQAVSGNLAEVSAHLMFDYVALNLDTEEPVADLAYAEIELTERGIWANIARQIQPVMLSEEVLLAGLLEELLPDYVAPEGGAPAPSGGKDEEEAAGSPNSPELDAAYEALARGAAAFASFAADPGVLRLELAPAEPVRLTEDHFEDITLFIADLAPALMTGADRPDPRLSAEELAALAIVAGGEAVTLDRDARMRIGAALITGRGVPRNPALAIEVLAPLMDAGDVAAIDLALPEFTEEDAAYAYRAALLAAAGGSRQAAAMLDGLEETIGAGDVELVQWEVEGGGGWAEDPTGSETARELREMASAAFLGTERPRNYRTAYRLALLAQALGDVAAGGIIAEIEAMTNRMDDEDADIFGNGLRFEQQEALALWPRFLD